MKFEFDKVWDRKNSGSMKWDAVDELFAGENLHPMWVADMDFQAPPAVLKALKEKVEHGIFGYPKRPDTVHEAIQQWMEKRFKWNVKKEHIQLTSGVVPTISQLILAFTEPEDKIIIQTPVYYPFYKLVTNNNRKLVENPLRFDGEKYQIDFSHLEACIDENTKMILLCSPHNPVGRVWTEEELFKLAKICEKHELLIIADEIHSDIVFSGHKHTPFASISPYTANRTITCMAPSKTFNLAGLQGSFLITENEELRKQIEEQLSSQFLQSTNVFAQVAMEAAYREGEEWLEELLSYLENNIQTTKDFLRNNIPQIEFIEPEGTYLIWLNFEKLQMTSAERKKWLISEAQLALSPGIVFGSAGYNFERLNIGCPTEHLITGLERLIKALPK